LLETDFRVWGFLSLRLVYTSHPSGGVFLEDRLYIRLFLDLWRQKYDCKDMPLRQLGVATLALLGVANGASCEFTPVVWEKLKS
jgi:hypothetical protein